MTTRAKSGYSDERSARSAGQSAARQALEGMSTSPELMLVFASTNYAFPELLRGVREVTGTAPLLGASTAGQFTEKSGGAESVVVMAVSSDSIRFRTGFAKGLRQNQRATVEAALSGFAEANRAARAEGLTHATCIVCADGLAGHGEDLVEQIHTATGMLAQVVGGAAADAAKFERTDVFHGEESAPDALAVAMAFSRTPIGLGVSHGLTAGCDSMIVTRASDNVLYEINSRPAVRAYEDFAASLGAPFTPETRDAFMITHEIGMLTPSGEHKIRAPLKVTNEGALVLASEVPTGTSVTIMRGTKDGLISAAESAARAAVKNLNGGAARAVLSFDCICRRLFLGDEYRRQVGAFRSVIGDDVPIVGWETYGEIAMTKNQQAGWHNSTSVLAILPD
ncbi:MAG: FIST C-terminal domain-containing protein [Myxococcales bacterium]|nr:FIST C-terminal domain-containing protein [Myxococcales bacterium]